MGIKVKPKSKPRPQRSVPASSPDRSKPINLPVSSSRRRSTEDHSRPSGSSSSSKRQRLSPPATAPLPTDASIGPRDQNVKHRTMPRRQENAGVVKDAQSDLAQNLTHTAQSQLLNSTVLSHEPVNLAEERGETSGWPGYEGLTDEEVFKIVSRPSRFSVSDQESGDGWEAAPERDSTECSEALKAKVATFIKLKYERNEHINTRLLSSSAFANPHIYSKLVDFVQIGEQQSAFPSFGWLTRRNIEAEIPLFGPASISAQQKAKQEATRRAQEIGKRREISFQPSRQAREGEAGRYRDGRDGRDGRGGADRHDSRDSRDVRDKTGDPRGGVGVEYVGIEGSSRESTARTRRERYGER